jgi:DNA-binding MarR family transcriptional regulator
VESLFELFLKHGIRPLSLFSEASELEKTVNRSELTAIIMLQYYDELTMSELAGKLGIPLSTMTSLAKRLVHKRLIERKQSGKDQRVILIRLTPEGMELSGRAMQIINNLLDRIQATLSDDELEQFLALSMKIANALQQKDGTVLEKKDDHLRRITIEE